MIRPFGPDGDFIPNNGLNACNTIKNGIIMNEAAIRTNPAIRSAAALILTLAGIFGSLHLKFSNTISEPSLVILLVTTVIAGFGVFVSDRLKSLDLRKLSVTLHAIKESEHSVRRLALALLELAESDEDGYKQPGWDVARYERAKDAIRKLAA